MDMHVHQPRCCIGFVMQDTPLIRLTDLALGVIIPAHAHVGMAGIVSDYVPPRFMGEARYWRTRSSALPHQAVTGACDACTQCTER